MSLPPARGRDQTPSPMAGAAAAAESPLTGAAAAAAGAAAAASDGSPAGAALRASKRPRTPTGRVGASELDTVKENLKKLTKKLDEETAKNKATTAEVETFYAFAKESRAKFAQHLFYFGEVDKALTQQRIEISNGKQANKEAQEQLGNLGNAFNNSKGEMENYLKLEVDKVRVMVKDDGESLLQELKKVQADTFQDAQKFKLASVKELADLKDLLAKKDTTDTAKTDKLQDDLQQSFQKLQALATNTMQEQFQETRQMLETAGGIQDAELDGFRNELKNVQNQIKASGGTCPCTSGRCPCKCNGDPPRDPLKDPWAKK
jgi:hypothetical protein